MSVYALNQISTDCNKIVQDEGYVLQYDSHSRGRDSKDAHIEWYINIRMLLFTSIQNKCMTPEPKSVLDFFYKLWSLSSLRISYLF